MASHPHVCSAHVLLSWYQLRVPWLVEHATKGRKHTEKAALRRYLHNIKMKILRLNVYELLFGILILIFYYYVWVGNETFAHWRQLPSSLWAGWCDYDQFWSLAGRVAQCCESYAQFFVFLYVTEQKSAVLCTYIIIIKLYDNTTLYNICIYIYII